MDVKEKLVELIDSARYWGCGTSEEISENLIANGVTVQEWTPVTDSPKGKGCYIVTVHHWLDGNPVTREAYWNGCDWLSCDKKRELTPRVTHWMPLPPAQEDMK